MFFEPWSVAVCSVGDVMDVVFSVCIVRRGAVGARVCRCCMFVCILWQFSMLPSA